MRELHEVVLTGLGAITALGDLTLHSGGMGFDAAPSNLAIEGFELGDYLTSQKTYLDRCSALALAGSALALRDAGITWPVADSEFGITLGTHLGCIETMQEFWDKVVERGVRVANPLLFSHSYFNSPISLCAIEFGLKGYHLTCCAGEASGIEAIRAAADAIRLGHASATLCGGVEALTPAREQFEPVERMGEAAVFLVLESAAHATGRGAKSARPLIGEELQVIDSTRSLEVFGNCGGAQNVLDLAMAIVR
jgi:3-oxoacyl-[acyl-carrier-protein] synthase II